MDMRTNIRPLLILVALAVMVGCGGGGGGGGSPQPPGILPIGGTNPPVPTATPVQTPVPTPTPTPQPISPNPQVVNFTGTGAASAQPIQVTEAGYSGTFTWSGCAGVLTIVAGATPTTFVATPVAPGNCIVNFADASGNLSYPMYVTVTTLTVYGT